MGEEVFSFAFTPRNETRGRNKIASKVAVALEIIGSSITDNEEGDWMLLHPTHRTMGFKEVLLGASAYSPGHGIYNAVKNTATVFRQIQAAVLRNILDGVLYEDLANDWKSHIRGRGLTPSELATRYWSDQSDAIRVAESASETWSFLLRNLLLDFVRGVAEYCVDGLGGVVGTASYARYVDWLTCLGIVPVFRNKEFEETDGKSSSRDAEELLDVFGWDPSVQNRLRLAPAITQRGEDMLRYLARCFRAARVMDYDRTILVMNSVTREVRAFDINGNKRGVCIVLWEPLLTDRGVVFDSPMQRLHGAVLRTQAVREHAKLCQLANTAPMSVLLARREDNSASGADNISKMVDKALGEGAEEAGQSAAARLIKFIIDIQNMRKVGDVAEVVDAYLRENGTQTLDNTLFLDPSRAGFGGSSKGGTGFLKPPQSTKPKDGVGEVMRDAVNTSVGKVVNNLFKAVSDLKSANADLSQKNSQISKELNESKRRMEAIAKASAGSDNCQYDAVDAWRALGEKDTSWELGDTLRALHQLPERVIRGEVDISGDMTGNQYVANSFFSRYIPPYLEEETRLSALWEQELLRTFKMHRVTNNQGEEISISYSNSSITLIIGPFFQRVLRATRLGFLVADDEAYKSEAELCDLLFKKSRVDAYLKDFRTTYLADVRSACAARKTINERLEFPIKDGIQRQTENISRNPAENEIPRFGSFRDDASTNYEYLSGPGSEVYGKMGSRDQRRHLPQTEKRVFFPNKNPGYNNGIGRKRHLPYMR
ncbi:Portal protein [Cacatuid alphaherpesvirus 2]|uniref:Portal protein n=1 Tax=Cacatuid alphaherpesvirus 2 TaxID=2604840 RepID=A0A5B9R4N6_9ALPH|nr:Portal protein [Cacatuid alphaherpesvirus 2]QEG54050.1 Portal protein [Cacatuid alphaherpesvirus 2]